MRTFTIRLILPLAVAALSVAGIVHAAEQALDGYRFGGTITGYVKSEPFLAFLDESLKGGGEQPDAIRQAFESRGAWAACLAILIGGLLLNLTPCVLPMIPVNLAIIGAGAAAGSRRRGFTLGTAYGVGIAVVYGILGLAAVLTGTRFGTLNASPWFNLAIAAVFLLLALGMFDVFLIDLSRFQSRLGTGGSGRGTVWTALFMGGVAALLAGACVAPAVIAVIVFATDLYNQGQKAGLLLPFLLGVGMALPWPLAGAGFACLPKPGRWMEHVKKGFGVIILLAALYYGWKGFALWRDRGGGAEVATQPDRDEGVPAPGEGVPAPAGTAETHWYKSLDEGLAAAQREGKPIFVDFWATWCKNCIQMDRSTFKDPAVRARLADFVAVKVQAENLSDPATKAVLDRFGVIGLPTYVVLVPDGGTP